MENAATSGEIYVVIYMLNKWFKALKGYDDMIWSERLEL